MAGTYQYNAPSKQSPPSQTASSGTAKSRIYEVFKHVIELDELSLPANDEDTKTQKKEDVLSMEYPLIKINDYILSKGEIRVMEIDCTGNVPKIMLKCVFVHKKFLSRNMPKDGDIISVALRNKTDMLKLVRNDYVITRVISGTNTTQMEGPTTLVFYGSLFIPWVSSSIFNFSYAGTSFGAMQDVAKKVGLGFASNEEDTDDKQVWISGYSTTEEYIENTVQRAYKDEISFFDMWVDIYYNLNFVNVNKQLMSSEDEVDPAAWLNNIDTEQTWGADTAEDKTIESVKVFSNFDGFRATPFYINTWRPDNKATNVTYEIGTKLRCHLFEHNEILFQDYESKKYWSFDMEPQYDPDKTDKYILLRGRATQNPELRGKDLAQANYSYPDMFVKNPWMGIQYTISNYNDSTIVERNGNHHKNYLKARLQNLINLKELNKLNVEITVNGLNMNVIRGDKTPIVLVQKDPVEGAMSEIESAGLTRLEQFYSGWFYVKGFKIKYAHENDDSAMSSFTQTFILTRREWPPPIAVDAVGTENNNTT